MLMISDQSTFCSEWLVCGAVVQMLHVRYYVPFILYGLGAYLNREKWFEGGDEGDQKIFLI